jgi:hypothetical protein
MLNKLLKSFLFVLTFLFSRTLFAQLATDTNESGMRSNDKIYVVMAICITILVGLFLYVANVDRKISKLED